jgi:hypothetical protein
MQEFRFLLPALPGFHLLVGHVCRHLDETVRKGLGRLVLLVSGVLHLLGALYLLQFHQVT